MRCGLPGEDCLTDHICPAMDGRPVTGGQWKARCPACHSAGRKLTLTLKGGRLLWHCHVGCSQEAVRQALAEVVPSCIAPSRSRGAARAGRPVDPDALLALAQQNLPATAVRVGILRLLGFSAAKARAELGLAKSTYYDALKELGRE